MRKSRDEFAAAVREKAAEMRTYKKRNFIRLTAILTPAAVCFVMFSVVIAGSVMNRSVKMESNIENSKSEVYNKGGDSEIVECLPNSESSLKFGVGSVVETENGTLRFTGEDDASVTFTLKKTNNDTIYFEIGGRFTSDLAYGSESLEKKYFCATTEKSPKKNDATILNDVLAVTVNGVRSPDGTLPSQIGEYEITVDFSELYSMDIQPETWFYISGFDVFFRNLK